MFFWLSEMLTANIYPAQLFLEHLLLLWSLGVYLLSWCWLPLRHARMFASCDNLRCRLMKLESSALFLMHPPHAFLTSSANCALIPRLKLAPIGTPMCTFVMHLSYYSIPVLRARSIQPLPIQQQELINIWRNRGLGFISVDYDNNLLLCQLFLATIPSIII